jgi:cytochrome c oxidase subunit 2
MGVRVRSPKGRPLAIGLGLTLVGSLVSACASTDPQNALIPAGPVAQMEVNLFNFIFVIAIAVFVVVEGILVYTVLRYRRRPDDRMPTQTHGNTALEVTWTIIPVIILAIIAVPTVTTIASATNLTPAPGQPSMNVKVVGHQWWWEFDYPTQGIVTADELHIPVGTRIDLDIESADVIHSFWVPRLGGKVQAIPNQHNSSWIEADQIGTYHAQCYQLCGLSHANMRFIVVVQSQADFNAWVKDQTTAPGKPPTAEALKGQQVFTTGACVGCHTIQGTIAKGTIGPDLTHIGSHETLAGATLANDPKDMAMWLHDPPGVIPGSIMPNLHLTTDQITALSAYLESLK